MNYEIIIAKWQEILRLRDWDIKFEPVEKEWRKTGDMKIDSDDRKAVLMLNMHNPKKENFEEVIIHELLHLKLWGMDQMIESLLYGVFGDDKSDPKFKFAYGKFMNTLESTVEDLTKSYLSLGAENKEISFGRVMTQVTGELEE